MVMTAKRSMAPEKEVLYTSGELARRCEVTPRTIHFYEQRGLLNVSKRRGEGYRYYGESAVDRVSKIKNLQSIGLSLEDIKNVIDLYFVDDGGAAAKRAVLVILRSHLADADKQIQELGRFRDEIFRSIVRIETLLSEIENKKHHDA